MSTYSFAFLLPLEEAFSRRYACRDDRAAIIRARSELEYFIGAGPVLPSSVCVRRLASDGRAKALGTWGFDPGLGFEWAVDGGEADMTWPDAEGVGRGA